MHIEVAGGPLPPITLIDTEAAALSDLAMAWLDKSTLGAKLLLQELDRAEIFEKSSLPPHIATMMSRVTFLDEGTGQKHEVQLVYPKDADSALHRISVLTPIGAALIGMPRGVSIDWPNRSGEFRRLRILDVVQPPAQS